jgi:hypothetical protein
MLNKITSLIITVVLLGLPIYAQKSNRPFGWDLTYSSILKANNIDSKDWIWKWLANKDYQPPAKKWISTRKGEPIASSILIEYPAFHAGEHSTIWLFRTKNSAHYWEETEDLRGRIRKKTVKTGVFDKILIEAFSWKQATPIEQKDPQSLPGYIGFLNLYDKGKSRQMLLTMEDFAVCKTEKCDSMKAGRLFHSLEPILLQSRNN